jgi:SHS2 domain-containing protein
MIASDASIRDGMRPFDIIEHPADVGFVAYGGTLKELFENAALAMCSLAGRVDQIEERAQYEIVASGADVESLLYAWLAEILAIADADQLVFRRVEVTRLVEPQPSAPGEASGMARGEPFDRQRHTAGTYVKAVTMHQFAIERDAKSYRARVFLDL